MDQPQYSESIVRATDVRSVIRRESLASSRGGQNNEAAEEVAREYLPALLCLAYCSGKDVSERDSREKGSSWKRN